MAVKRAGHKRAASGEIHIDCIYARITPVRSNGAAGAAFSRKARSPAGDVNTRESHRRETRTEVRAGGGERES